MTVDRKPLVWMHGEVRTPPFSPEARREAGYLLARLQLGEILSMPRSRPMPSIGPRCHELRIVDENRTWRIFYRIDHDAIVIAEVAPKTTRTTPKAMIELCRSRFAAYDAGARTEERGKRPSNREG